MKLLYGTGNQAKLSAMRSRLDKIHIELIGLQDLRAAGKQIPEVAETGATPFENARLKAMTYYEAFQIPVFSCDSGLYFENVPEEIQPGVHVRNINGRRLSDDEMVVYYTGLARKYGTILAQYKNAVCFVRDETHIYESMNPRMFSKKFFITDRQHSDIREKGFPLDSISVDAETGMHFYDITEDKLNQFAVEDEVLEFFKDNISEGVLHFKRAER